MRSQCRLKVRWQKLQDSPGASDVPLSVLQSSRRADCSGVGGAGVRVLSRLLPEVAGVFESACSSITDELSLVGMLVESKAGSSSSEGGSVVRRYGACITGLTSSSKAKGLKEEESEKSRESPNLDNDEVQRNEEEIKRRKGEDYVGLRPRLVFDM